MGGRMSRNKGARGERSLCMHLNLLGYDARRVIRTRAVKGFEKDNVVDVEIWEGGEVRYTFESKSRKNSFTTIYKLYEKERCGQSVCRFNIGGQLVAIGSDFEEVKKTSDVHFRALVPLDRRDALTHQRLLNLRKLLKGAMFLTIKDNGKFVLFLKFWG